MKIEAFTYEADTHCCDCAVARFGKRVMQETSPEMLDKEGNAPRPVFSTDEIERPMNCGTCRNEIN